ncbi:MAG: hypothetical protein KDM63_06205, partial [Verrucomicrobiae bacterium]|nr:hypothetical protein [Verrucomicrobiae bacterium]
LPVTVINGDKRKGAALLKQWETSFPESRLRVIDRPLSYPEYLRLMASHRLVFQLDRSHVPGQVAGDAGLCRILCAGGNSALERLIDPDLADDGTESSLRIEEKLEIVLTNEEAYREAVASASHRAKDRAGFLSVAEVIGRFIRELQE